MGTNYYVRTIDCKHCGSKQEIHIGKSSMGWSFTFQYNGGQYYKSVPEMKRWLKGKQIWDEYGKRVSKKEFWELVEWKQKESLRHEQEAGDRHSFSLDGYSFIDCEFS